ncbi:MAG: GNAT family N-acetyltransferase [Hyphomicrobiales bacterium]
MSDVVIRQATVEDLEAARSVIIETWRTTYVPIHGGAKVEDIISRWHSPQNIEQQIGSKDALFGVATLNGQCVGHVYAAENEGLLKIHRLYVLPAAQGAGVGRQLMDFALGTYPHARDVTLEVDEANQAAIAFYQHLGMAISGSTPCCGDDSDIPALIMSVPRQELRTN